MTVEQNKALARRFIEEVWNQGNLSVIDELASPNYVQHDAPPGLPPGRDGLKAFVELYRAAFPDLKLIVDDVFAEGDMVAARWTGQGTHLGPLFGIPATGKWASVPGISVDRLENGKVVEEWNSSNQLSLFQQLGLAPTPGE